MTIPYPLIEVRTLYEPITSIIFTFGGPGPLADALGHRSPKKVTRWITHPSSMTSRDRTNLRRLMIDRGMSLDILKKADYEIVNYPKGVPYPSTVKLTAVPAPLTEYNLPKPAVKGPSRSLTRQRPDINYVHPCLSTKYVNEPIATIVVAFGGTGPLADLIFEHGSHHAVTKWLSRPNGIPTKMRDRLYNLIKQHPETNLDPEIVHDPVQIIKNY